MRVLPRPGWLSASPAAPRGSHRQVDGQRASAPSPPPSALSSCLWAAFAPRLPGRRPCGPRPAEPRVRAGRLLQPARPAAARRPAGPRPRAAPRPSGRPPARRRRPAVLRLSARPRARRLPSPPHAGPRRGVRPPGPRRPHVRRPGAPGCRPRRSPTACAPRSGTPPRGRFMTVPTFRTGAATTDRAGGASAGRAGTATGLRTAANACRGTSVRPIATANPATIGTTRRAANPRRATASSRAQDGCAGQGDVPDPGNRDERDRRDPLTHEGRATIGRDVTRSRYDTDG